MKAASSRLGDLVDVVSVVLKPLSVSVSMMVRVGDGRCRSGGKIRVIQAVYGGLVPHRKPFPVRVHGQLDRRMAELALNVGRAFSLLEQQTRVSVAGGVR